MMIRTRRMADYFFVALALVAMLFATSIASAHDEGVEQKVLQVLADYEQIRASLAADRGAGIAPVARRIAQRAQHARREADGTTARSLGAIRTAANSLARTDANDLAALRRGFGQLSRPLVALIQAMPRVARGRHLFECPMADGYNRWIQTNRNLENPYMGQRMLACGAPVEAGRP